MSYPPNNDKIGGGGGTGGTHMYSYLLVPGSTEAKMFALLLYTEELTAYASGIQASHPNLYAKLQKTIEGCVARLEPF